MSLQQPNDRRTEPRSLADFDEQLWPVNVLLLILAGCVAGLIVAQANFHTPELWKNGWVQLGILAAAVLALALGAAFLGGVIHRRMQLAVLLALLAHLWMSLGMHEYNLPVINEDGLVKVAEEKSVTLPDYRGLDAPERTVPEAFEKPVETAVPEIKEIETPQREKARTRLDPQPAAEPTAPAMPAPKPQPKPVEIKRAEASAPKRGEHLPTPERSRQEIAVRRAPEQEKLTVPKQSAPAKASEPEPAVAEVRSQPGKVAAPEKTAAEPLPEVRKSPVAPALRQPSEPRPEVPALARAIPRRDVELTARSQERPVSAPPSSSAQPAAASPEPAALALSRKTPALAPRGALPSGSGAFGPAPSIASLAGLTPHRAEAGAPSNSMPSPLALARSAGPAPGVPSAPLGPLPATPGASAPLATEPRPAATSLSKSGGGAGLPSSSTRTLPNNVATGLPGAGTGPIGPATGTARRVAATEPSATGPGNAPGQTIDVPKSRVGADVAAAALPAAQANVVPDSTGSAKPSPLEASSGLAVKHSTAQAPLGPSSGPAAPGDPTLEIGPPQLASAIGPGGGMGRGLGGGQPSVSLPGPTLGRASLSAEPSAGIPVEAAVPGSSSGQAGVPGGGGGTGGAPGGGVSDGGGLDSLASAPGRAGGGGFDVRAILYSGGSAADSRGFGPGAGGGSEIGPRRAGASDVGPVVSGSAEGSSQTLSKQSNSDIPGSVLAEIGPVPLAASGPPSSPLGPAGDGLGPSGSGDDIGPRPRESLGLPIRGAASTETSGPGDLASANVGLPDRRARLESEVVHATTPRLILEKTGGKTAIDARVRDTAVPGLKQRDREGREAIAKSRGGSEVTERAVEAGLDFLARHQSADGSWSLHDFGAGHDYVNAGAGQMQSNTAGTGLALLSFLGAGYTHTDGKYQGVVQRGLNFLVGHQKSDGDLFQPLDPRSNINVWLYSHGIASIALCEAYGMTRDPPLQRPAQLALNFIVFAQSPDEGGWRYSPQRGSDTSVSGWQVMALKSGELAGLSVPPDCYAKLTHWLDHAQGAGGNPSRYAYRPLSTQQHQREPSRVMTAEALLMRQYLGWKRDNPNMVEGADWIRLNLPEFGGADREHPAGQRDAYYWYYATQVMFQMQGDYWRDWNARLGPLLINSQTSSGPLAGSWDPELPVPDRWGHFGGRLYVTSLHLLMLEVYYRHLPIYQTLESENER